MSRGTTTDLLDANPLRPMGFELGGFSVSRAAFKNVCVFAETGVKGRVQLKYGARER